MYVDTGLGVGSYPGYALLRLVPNGATAIATVMRWDADGTCTLGASKATPLYDLHANEGIFNAAEALKFTGAMGNSTKNPTSDAPADWIQCKIGATTYYIPVYAA